MKYYIIAGEVSGDLHASNLMKQLRALDPSAEFRCWGGDRMAAAGGSLVKHIDELAFMGFWEVIMNLSTIMANLKLCRKDMMEFSPDVLVLIDYPGFNLRMARFARSQGIRVVYYISPQIWAWKQSRIRRIRRDVDKMLVILPFEQDFYNKLNFSVEFPGHPLLDALEEDSPGLQHQDFLQSNQLDDRPLVALLPGSRRQEVSRMLGVMLSLAPKFPGVQFVVAGLKGLGSDFYGPFAHLENVSIVFDQTYTLLMHARAALVASGTATLEAALFDVPQAVCYRASTISYQLARWLVNVKYISLVNLVMDREVVRELIQKNFNEQVLTHELDRLLHDEAYRDAMKEDYRALRLKLGGSGASRKAADIIYKLVEPHG